MTMKYDNAYNLFWAIVWAVLLILAIIAIFGHYWLPIIIIAGFSAVMCGIFVADFIRVNKFK